jgi:hypothetical protein
MFNLTRDSSSGAQFHFLKFVSVIENVVVVHGLKSLLQSMNLNFIFLRNKNQQQQHFFTEQTKKKKKMIALLFTKLDSNYTVKL